MVAPVGDDRLANPSTAGESPAGRGYHVAPPDPLGTAGRGLGDGGPGGREGRPAPSPARRQGLTPHSSVMYSSTRSPAAANLGVVELREDVLVDLLAEAGDGLERLDRPVPVLGDLLRRLDVAQVGDGLAGTPAGRVAQLADALGQLAGLLAERGRGAGLIVIVAAQAAAVSASAGTTTSRARGEPGGLIVWWAWSLRCSSVAGLGPEEYGRPGQRARFDPSGDVRGSGSCGWSSFADEQVPPVQAVLAPVDGQVPRLPVASDGGWPRSGAPDPRSRCT